jgi:hypothetical protein
MIDDTVNPFTDKILEIEEEPDLDFSDITDEEIEYLESQQVSHEIPSNDVSDIALRNMLKSQQAYYSKKPIKPNFKHHRYEELLRLQNEIIEGNSEPIEMQNKISVYVKGKLGRGTINNRMVMEYVVSGYVSRPYSGRGDLGFGKDTYYLTVSDAKLSRADLERKLAKYRDQSLEKFKAYLIIRATVNKSTHDSNFDYEEDDLHFDLIDSLLDNLGN